MPADQVDIAECLYDNVAEWPDELAFGKADLLRVLDRSPADSGQNIAQGWWLCQDAHGRRGIAPANRLRLVHNKASAFLTQTLRQQPVASVASPRSAYTVSPRNDSPTMNRSMHYGGPASMTRSSIFDDAVDDLGMMPFRDDPHSVFLNSRSHSTLGPAGRHGGRLSFGGMQPNGSDFDIMNRSVYAESPLSHRESPVSSGVVRNVPIRILRQDSAPTLVRPPVPPAPAPPIGRHPRPRMAPPPPQRRYFNVVNQSDDDAASQRSTASAASVSHPTRSASQSTSADASRIGVGDIRWASTVGDAENVRHQRPTLATVSTRVTASPPQTPKPQASKPIIDQASHGSSAAISPPSSTISDTSNRSSVGDSPYDVPQARKPAEGTSVVMNVLEDLYTTPNRAQPSRFPDVADSASKHASHGSTPSERLAALANNAPSPSTMLREAPSKDSTPEPHHRSQDNTLTRQPKSALAGSSGPSTVKKSVKFNPVPQTSNVASTSASSATSQPTQESKPMHSQFLLDMEEQSSAAVKMVGFLTRLAENRQWRQPQVLQANLVDVNVAVNELCHKLDLFVTSYHRGVVNRGATGFIQSVQQSMMVLNRLRDALNATGWTLGALSRRAGEIHSSDALDQYMNITRRLPAELRRVLDNIRLHAQYYKLDGQDGDTGVTNGSRSPTPQASHQPDRADAAPPQPSPQPQAQSSNTHSNARPMTNGNAADVPSSRQYSNKWTDSIKTTAPVNDKIMEEHELLSDAESLFDDYDFIDEVRPKRNSVAAPKSTASQPPVRQSPVQQSAPSVRQPAPQQQSATPVRLATRERRDSELSDTPRVTNAQMSPAQMSSNAPTPTQEAPPPVPPPPAAQRNTQPSTPKLNAADMEVIHSQLSQLDTHIAQLSNAIETFFTTVETRQQGPMEFVAKGKLVILAAHKLVYMGDTVAQCISAEWAREQMRASSDALCDTLKTCVQATRAAADAYPNIDAVQGMVDAVLSVSHSAHQLRVHMKRCAQ